MFSAAMKSPHRCRGRNEKSPARAGLLLATLSSALPVVAVMTVVAMAAAVTTGRVHERHRGRRRVVAVAVGRRGRVVTRCHVGRRGVDGRGVGRTVARGVVAAATVVVVAARSDARAGDGAEHPAHGRAVVVVGAVADGCADAAADEGAEHRVRGFRLGGAEAHDGHGGRAEGGDFREGVLQGFHSGISFSVFRYLNGLDRRRWTRAPFFTSPYKQKALSKQ